MEGCGGLWRVVEGCGCGRLCRAVEGCGGLWRAVEGCGGLWRAVEGCGGLWRCVEGCGCAFVVGTLHLQGQLRQIKQNTTQHNTTQRNATQRNTTQHNTTQHPLKLRKKSNLCEFFWGVPGLLAMLPNLTSDQSKQNFGTDRFASFWPHRQVWLLQCQGRCPPISRPSPLKTPAPPQHPLRAHPCPAPTPVSPSRPHPHPSCALTISLSLPQCQTRRTPQSPSGCRRVGWTLSPTAQWMPPTPTASARARPPAHATPTRTRYWTPSWGPGTPRRPQAPPHASPSAPLRRRPMRRPPRPGAGGAVGGVPRKRKAMAVWPGAQSPGASGAPSAVPIGAFRRERGTILRSNPPKRTPAVWRRRDLCFRPPQPPRAASVWGRGRSRDGAGGWGRGRIRR